MGGKQSTISKLHRSSDSADLDGRKDVTKDESSLPNRNGKKLTISHDQTGLAQAVAEANEHLFLEHAKYHRARIRLSVRSLFTTATNMSLSERQKITIRQTWKLAIADGKLKPGVTIFQNIFRRCPDLKRVFSLSHVQDLDDLPKEDRFRRHANVFSDVIDLAVRNMDELDAQMAPALVTLGRRHYYKHSVGFRADYLAVFAHAMLDFVSERLQLATDKEGIDGWWVITVYLITKMQHGYALESMGKNSNKSKRWQLKKKRGKPLA